MFIIECPIDCEMKNGIKSVYFYPKYKWNSVPFCAYFQYKNL
jgi:hypothetical protein